MSIAQWNCRGIRSNSEQLKVLIRDCNVSVVAVQETKLAAEPFNPGINYAFHRSPPVIGERAKGGTGFIIHRSIKHNVLQLNTSLQACAIRAFIGKSITLCSLYLDPDLESYLFDDVGNRRPLLLNDLQSLVDQLPQPFILMGDFNAKNVLWGENYNDRWGQIIEQLLDANDVILLNDGTHTRFDLHHGTSSAIDLSICSSVLGLDYKWSVLQSKYGSDHFPIVLQYLKNMPSPCLPKWKIEEADFALYRSLVEVRVTKDDFASPIEAYNFLTNFITEKAHNSIPRTSGRPSRPVVPWWSKKCAVARKVTRTCFRRYLRTKYHDDKIAYARALAKQKKIFKEAKRNSWKKYISKLTTKSTNSEVWNKIRKLQGKFVPSPLPILHVNGNEVSDPKAVADELARHFANVSSPNNYSREFQHIRNSEVIHPPASNNTEAFNLPFTMEELMDSLSKSSSTSPGEDEIHYEMISNLPQNTKFFLLEVFNGLWDSSIPPSSWIESIIVPCLKPGKDPSLPGSYRPIALTSCLCKLFERMVNGRLVWYLESKNYLSPRQFGFRKNRSTLDPLLMLSREVQNALGNQNQTIGVFFDLEKAYDTTWRGGILKQLASWGIGGRMFNFIKEFLSNRSFKVRVGSEFSDPFVQEEGVPQGSVLSVTLFAAAINSIMENVPVGVQGSLFVDDFAIYCSGSNAVEVCHKVQQAINAVTRWADKRGFQFSALKTKAIRFTRRRRMEEVPTLVLKDVILPYEDQIKFLGVIFDKKLTFGPHINNVATNVRQSLNILKVVSHFDWGADRTTLLRLYTSLCLSRIDYACQIYSSACKTHLSKLDVVHNMGLRICTGAYKTSPVESLYVVSGMPALAIRREELGLRYISKIMTSKNNPNYKYIARPVDRSRRHPKLPKPLEVRLEDSSRVAGLSDQSVSEITVSKLPPWCRPSIKICPIKSEKKSSTPRELKLKFLEHLGDHSHETSIFTDGSKNEDGVGYSAVIGDNIIKRKLPANCSVFTAELHGVLASLKHIFNSSQPNQKYVIHTDSQSSLSSLKQLYPRHPLVQEVQEWLILLHCRKKCEVCFCWVPAHVDIKGNEEADIAAKEAINLAATMDISVPHIDMKRVIHSSLYRKWQEKWSSLTSNVKLRSICPDILRRTPSCKPSRRQDIILTRLRIGHSHLTHSYMMKNGEERRVPQCEACQCELTVKHFLVECPEYARERRANLLANLSLEDILMDEAYGSKILKFLSQIGLYSLI